MKIRQIVLGLLGLAVVVGTISFISNAVQTRTQLGQVSSTDANTQVTGVNALMARGVLFDALQGGAQKETRLTAVDTLGRLVKGGKNPEAFKQLLQMLKDPDTESAELKTHPVRDKARDTVAAIGMDYPKELLDATADPDGNIKGQSLDAVKKIGAPLKDLMAQRIGDGKYRSQMADALSAIGPETIGLIAPWMQKDEILKDDAAKTNLIETMGKFKVAEAVTPVLAFAKDPNPNIRRAVIAALANIGQPGGASVLIEALVNPDTDATARAAAAGALGAIASPEANNAMLTALGDYDLTVATAAAAGLKRAGDAARPQIMQALASTDVGVRTRAAESAGGLKDTAPVIKALSDTAPEVRAVAATSLGEILTKNPTLVVTGLPALTSAISDTDGTVAQNASEAMGRLKGAAVSALLTKLADPSDTVAYHASQALIQVGKDAVPALITLAAPSNPAARWAAVTLGEIGDTRATDALGTLKSSSDPDTASAAEVALSKVKA
jgi:HEAT repeat protein